MIDTELKNPGSPELASNFCVRCTAKWPSPTPRWHTRFYKQIFPARAGKPWRQGRAAQRLLWASTSTKNPDYRDVLCIEALIGPDTVNTIPPATMDAFRDHGTVRRTLDADVAAADETMANLEKAGISMQKVTNQLLEEAIKLFDDAFHKLIAAVAEEKEPVSTKTIINRPAGNFPPLSRKRWSRR